MYNLQPKLWTKCCFMKQKCQLQIGVAQYEKATMPISTRGINSTCQQFQTGKVLYNFGSGQGAQKLHFHFG